MTSPNANILKCAAFAATVAHGSFTKAAAELGCTQSGVSRMIGDLEREWGLRLLNRRRGGVCPTADGARLLPAIQRVCAAGDNLAAHVASLKGTLSGLIRIGTISSIAAHWLPRIIRAFQADFPGIDYELLTGGYGDVENWLREGRVDCGFTRRPSDASGFEAVPLGEDPLMAVLPLRHPLAQRRTVPLAALCEDPFLALERDESHDIGGIFARAGLEPRTKFTTLDDYAILAMVECGLGVSILPRLILRRSPYRVAVREIRETPRRELALLLRAPADASPAVRKFVTYLDRREPSTAKPSAK